MNIGRTVYHIANNFRVLVDASQDWEKMKILGTQTIKIMLKASATKQESTSKVLDMQKKSRAQKVLSQKSKAIVESESSDLADKHATKAVGGKGVQSSSKPRSRSSVMETKTISTDHSLLMPERVDSGQTEFDVHHQAKPSGVKDILQSTIASSPGAMMKFVLTQVLTQLSQHLEQTKASADQGGRVIRSTAQVLKELNYTIPKIDSAYDFQSSSKDYDSTKEDDDDEKPKVKTDDKWFKIPQGTSHHNKKKLKADYC